MIQIRLASRQDLPALEWDGEYVRFRRLYADVYHLTQKGEALMWIADSSTDGLIGQLFVSLKSSRADLSDGRNRAYVYAFRVKPAFRGQGIGTRMMTVVEADLRRRGYLCVTLNVAQENADARRLYERLGYQVVGADPGRWSYIDQNGLRREMHEPAWRMEKAL